MCGTAPLHRQPLGSSEPRPTHGTRVSAVVVWGACGRAGTAAAPPSLLPSSKCTAASLRTHLRLYINRSKNPRTISQCHQKQGSVRVPTGDSAFHPPLSPRDTGRQPVCVLPQRPSPCHSSAGAIDRRLGDYRSQSEKHKDRG